METTRSDSGFTLIEVTVAMAIIGPLMVALLSASGAVGTAVAENERRADVTAVTRGVGDRLQKIVMRAAPKTLEAKPVALIRVLQSDVVIKPRTTTFYTQQSNLQPIDSTQTTGGAQTTGDATSGADADVKQTGSAVTSVVSLLDMKDESYYVTSYENYTDYRKAYFSQLSAPPSWEPVPQGMPIQSLKFVVVAGMASMNAASRTETVEFEFIRDAGEQLDGLDNDQDGMIDEGKLFFSRGETRTVMIDNVEICTFTLEGRVIRFVIRACRRDSNGRVHRTTIQKRILIRNRE